MQKRSEVRRSAIVPTDVSAPFWNESLDLVAADVSPRGMYLISEEMPQIGDTLFCSFALATEDPEYFFFSKVRRINWHRRKTDALRPGFGVEFVDANPHKLQMLRHALLGTPPPIPSKRREAIRTPPIPYANIMEGNTYASKWYYRETNRRLLTPQWGRL